jgi:ornithine cyclodeaminase/alanine dehydrogenase
MAVFLTEKDAARLLPMSDAIAAVEEAFRALGQGKAVNRPRARIKLPGVMLHVMPAGLGSEGALGFKAYTVTRAGARFFYFHFDASSGELVAVMEADRLGQIRTGAASGVATRYLARAAAATVGIVGTGWQARSQLEAMAAVRAVRSAVAYSPTPERLAAFCREMSGELGFEVRSARRPEEVTEGADIVITATSAREPVLRGSWLREGQHLNAVGSNFAEKQEIDAEAVARASVVVVDSIEQARIECGDLIAPIAAGVETWDRVRELADVVSGKTRGRTGDEQVTLFESQGLALEDVAVATKVWERARAEGIGTPLPF